MKKIGRESAEAMFGEHIAPLGLEGVDTTTCHKAASVIMAYAFDIPGKTSQDGHDDTGDDGDDLISDDGEEKTLLSMVVSLSPLLECG